MPAYRAIAGRRRRRRPGPRRQARGALRRARHRAAPPEGPVPRHGARAPGPRLVSIIGPGGHRQEPPRVGAAEVRRRHRRGRLLARRPFARPTARASPSGRSARWSALAPGSTRPTTRPRRARSWPRRSRGSSRRGPERERVELALQALLGVGEAARRSRRAVQRVAPVFRADGGRGPRGPGLRGPPLGRRGPARLHRPRARVEPERPDPDHHPGPTRAARAPARLGRRAPQLPRARSRAARPGGDARAARRASCRDCPSRRSDQSSRAPRACRSTRSRRSGCSPPTVACASAPRAASSPWASSASWPCPTPSTR